VGSGLTGGAGTQPRSSAVHSEKPERSDAIATAPLELDDTRFRITENAVHCRLRPKTAETIRIPQPPLSFPGSCHAKSWQFPTKRVMQRTQENEWYRGPLQVER
jgi:hypothetical protein